MSSYRRSEDAGDDAAQPLYRDSNEHTEKLSRTQDDDDHSRALQASIRRLRRWLVAVSVLLGLATAYILFSHRNVIRDHQTSKTKSFAPERKSSVLSKSTSPAHPLTLHHSRSPPNPTHKIRTHPLRLRLNPRSRRSLGQRPHAPRRRIRPNPQPCRLLPPSRPTHRRKRRHR
jgi:hypothetical protein